MLFIHGGKDAFVPFAMLDEVYAAARCPKEKYVEPDAGHAESLRMAPARYWAKVFGFIGRWMPLPGAERTVAADPAEKPVYGVAYIKEKAAENRRHLPVLRCFCCDIQLEHKEGKHIPVLKTGRRRRPRLRIA